MITRGLVLTTIICSLSLALQAQKKPTELKGYLGVQGGESYTYRLVFTDSAGHLKGHSYTYLYETKEVKAAITGYLDRANKTLRFKETEIIYNHGFESSTTICLITALLRARTGSDGKQFYSGSITSSDVSNVYCGQGTVSFPVTAELNALFTAPAAAPPAPAPVAPRRPSKPVKIVYDTVSAKAPPRPAAAAPQGPETVTYGKDKMIDWHSEVLVLELWDGGVVDGDRLSIRCNSKALVKDYLLAKEPKSVVHQIPDTGIYELVFTADHEGNQPPMTADVWLVDGEKRHRVVVYNNLGFPATVRIRKLPQ